MKVLWSIMSVALGYIHKLISKLDSPVKYQLPVGDDLIDINEFIGKYISLRFKNDIKCVACGKKIKKTFNDGYCFICLQSLARCDICILKPEQCHYYKGTCREPKWGEENCFIKHYAYLANTAGVKVGITRSTQVPYRFIDQGATQAMIISSTSSRYVAGLLERTVAGVISDKTDWRKMLQGVPDNIDLPRIKDMIFDQCGEQLEALEDKLGGDIEFLDDEEIINISYPVNKYPLKVKTLTFSKTPLIEGTLLGIKGQYLILDTGVLNIRKHTAYKVEFN